MRIDQDIASTQTSGVLLLHVYAAAAAAARSPVSGERFEDR